MNSQLSKFSIILPPISEFQNISQKKKVEVNKKINFAENIKSNTIQFPIIKFELPKIEIKFQNINYEKNDLINNLIIFEESKNSDKSKHS